jgi:glutamate synthase domain-containing protein 1
MAGYPLAQAVMMMIPEPWEQHTLMDERRKAFYEYHAAMLEPWDGPRPSCSPTAARSAPRWTATACVLRATA